MQNNLPLQWTHLASAKQTNLPLQWTRLVSQCAMQTNLPLQWTHLKHIIKFDRRTHSIENSDLQNSLLSFRFNKWKNAQVQPQIHVDGGLTFYRHCDPELLKCLYLIPSFTRDITPQKPTTTDNHLHTKKTCNLQHSLQVVTSKLVMNKWYIFSGITNPRKQTLCTNNS